MKRSIFYLVLAGMITVSFLAHLQAWGINYFRYLSPYWLLVFIVPFLVQEKKLYQLGTFLLKSPYAYGACMLVFVALAILFRQDFPLSGDGYALITQLWRYDHGISNFGTLYNDFGAVQVVRGVAHLLNHDPNFGAYTDAFKYVSHFSGLAYIVMVLYYVRNWCSWDTLRSALLVIGLFFVASSCLFFGYTEFYPLPYLAMTAFLLCAVFGVSRIHLYLWFAVGLFLHAFVIVLAPVFLIAFRSHWFWSDRTAKTTKMLMVAFSVLVVVAIYFFGGRMSLPVWTRFASLAHVWEIAQVALLLCPLLLIGYVSYRQRIYKTVVPVILFCVGASVCLFAGVMRDWDILSVVAPASVIMFALMLEPNTAARYFLFSGCFAVLWWATLASPSFALKLEEVSKWERGHSLRSFYIADSENLRKYYYQTGNADKEMTFICNIYESGGSTKKTASDQMAECLDYGRGAWLTKGTRDRAVAVASQMPDTIRVVLKYWLGEPLEMLK